MSILFLFFFKKKENKRPSSCIEISKSVQTCADVNMLVCEKTPDTVLFRGVHAQVLTVAKVTLVPVVGVTILWAVPGCTANTEPTDAGWEIQRRRQEGKRAFQR